MAHREVYGLLHEVLVSEAPDAFVFADLGCGTATGSAGALAGTQIGRYVGVDISEPSLEVAREALEALPCPVELRHQDFPGALQTWSGPLDVVWIGQSLHHLRAPEKETFMLQVARLLPPDGLFWLGAQLALRARIGKAGWSASDKCAPTGQPSRMRSLPLSTATMSRPITQRPRRHGRGWLERPGSLKPTNSLLSPMGSLGSIAFATDGRLNTNR